jgi:hypothetical protein
MDLPATKDKLAGLAALLAGGLITQEDFNREKREVLSQYRLAQEVPSAPPTAIPIANWAENLEAATLAQPPTNAVCYCMHNDCRESLEAFTTEELARHVLQAHDRPDRNNASGNLSVDLVTDVANPQLVRVRIEAEFKGGASEQKTILVNVLDRSGSMREDWPKVVESMDAVLTAEILADPDVFTSFVVFAAEAKELDLCRPPPPLAIVGSAGTTDIPPTNRSIDCSQRNGALLTDLRTELQRNAPENEITVFRSAFEIVREVRGGEVHACDEGRGARV